MDVEPREMQTAAAIAKVVCMMVLALAFVIFMTDSFTNCVLK